MFFTCFGTYYCVYSPSMYDVVDASTTRRLPAQIQDFLLFNCTLFFSESYVCFMSCNVTETMLYCIQTIYCKGSGETAHLCKLV